MRGIHTIAAVACAGLLLGACTSMEAPRPVMTEIKTNSSLATTTGLSQVLVRTSAEGLFTCTQPQPDATFDQGEAGNLSLSLVSLGGNDQGTENEDTQELEMAGRTPAVLMARELFFRACEFSGNYQLSKAEALDLYTKTLTSISQVWATEATHTTISISNSLSATETTAASPSTK